MLKILSENPFQTELNTIREVISKKKLYAIREHIPNSFQKKFQIQHCEMAFRLQKQIIQISAFHNFIYVSVDFVPEFSLSGKEKNNFLWIIQLFLSPCSV